MKKSAVLISSLGIVGLLASCQNSTPHIVDPITGIGVKGGDTSEARPYAVSSSANVDDLVELMLRHQPALVAAAAEIEMLRAQSVADSSLPDPMVKLTAGSMAETAAGRVDALVGVEQKIPNPSRLSAKKNRTLEQAKAASAAREAMSLKLSYQLRNVYWSYYQDYQSISIHQQSKALLSDLQQSVEARVAAGAAAQEDLLRISTEISKVDRQLIQLRRNLTTYRSTLNTLLFRPPSSALPSPRYVGASIGKKEMNVVANSHPEIRQALAQIGVAEQSIRLARLQRSPDFVAGLSYGAVSSSGLAPSANGRDQVMGTIGMSIPLWEKKNRAAEASARSALDAAKAGTSVVRQNLRSEAASAAADITAQKELIDLFEKRIIPDSKQAFELSTTAYTNGKSTFTDVIDTWRQLLNYELQQVSNKASMGKATARFKYATNS